MLMIDTNVLRQLSIYRKEIIAQSTVLCSSSGIGSCRDTRSEGTRNSNGVIQPQLRKRAIKGPVGVKIEHI